MTEPDGTVIAIWPRPWRYEPKGYNGGPCVVDGNGHVIAALFWPTHPTFHTIKAEGLVEALGRMIAVFGEEIDAPH